MMDYYSITERLSEIEDYTYGVFCGEKEPGEYYRHYEELISEIQIGASELYDSLHDIIRDFERRLPLHDGAAGHVGQTWFDTLLGLIDDFRMIEALGLDDGQWFDGLDEDAGFYGMLPKGMKTKLDMFFKLTKTQMMESYCSVFNFLMDYTRLDNAFKSVVGVINALEENNVLCGA